MNIALILLIIIFFYTYLGYPFLLFLLNFFTRKKHKNANKKNDNYNITVVIPVLDEISELDKLLNSISEYDYRGKINVIFVVDGGSKKVINKINKLKKQYRFRVDVIDSGERLGKTECQNIGVQKASDGNMILFTDVRARLNVECLSYLVDTLIQEDAGSVTGKVVYSNSNSSREGLYLRYENIIRQLESNILGTVVASGAVLLFRKSFYENIPKDIVNDVAIPIMIKINNGKNLKFNHRAICNAVGAKNSIGEIKRHRRTIAQFLYSLTYIWPIFNPIKFPIMSVFLLSHKILRFIMPFVILLMLITSVFIWFNESSYLGLFFIITIIGCLLLATIGLIRIRLNKENNKIISILSHYLSLNLAATFAWYDLLAGNRYDKWKPKNK